MGTTTPQGRLATDRRALPVALFLVVIVATIYAQTYRHEFIMFDDDVYIRDNPVIARGLTWSGFVWAFGFREGNWHPLTWISHMLDAQLFGLWAGGHHLMSAAIHAANAAILLGVLRAMTGALWRNAAVAALFALHPLRVESVAWAAERKDVLSAFLGLLAMWAYLRYSRRPGALRYLAALGLFGLGLAAKPMLVTLPFVLLLLDWWPLARALPQRAAGSGAAGVGTRPVLWRLVWEKTPFFALSLISSLVTLRGQTAGVLKIVTPDLETRLANAAVSYLKYLGSFVWPADLAILYPYPRGGIAAAVVAVSVAALVLISVATLAFGRRRPYLPVGWLWYLGTLVPVIGLVQVGGQARGDRYTYFALTGVAMALAWLAADLWPRGKAARRVLAASLALALAALAAASASYLRVWRDSLQLFEHTARVTSGNFQVLNNLGSILMDHGRGDEALRVLRDAETINPKHCNAPYNQGEVLIRLGRHAEALPPLSRALACYQKEGRNAKYIADTHFNMGVAYKRLGRYYHADWHFRVVKRLVPDFPGINVALGELRALRGAQPSGRPRE